MDPYSLKHFEFWLARKSGLSSIWIWAMAGIFAVTVGLLGILIPDRVLLIRFGGVIMLAIGATILLAVIMVFIGRKQ